MIVLFGFIGFILFFTRPLADFFRSTFGRLYSKNLISLLVWAFGPYLTTTFTALSSILTTATLPTGRLLPMVTTPRRLMPCPTNMPSAP